MTTTFYIFPAFAQIQMEIINLIIYYFGLECLLDFKINDVYKNTWHINLTQIKNITSPTNRIWDEVMVSVLQIHDVPRPQRPSACDSWVSHQLKMINPLIKSEEKSGLPDNIKSVPSAPNTLDWAFWGFN